MKIQTTKKAIKVSVPYGDLFYFYKKIAFLTKQNNEKFPSPLGIFFISILRDDCTFTDESRFSSPMGFFFISIMKTGRKASWTYEFPSPIGILFISITDGITGRKAIIPEFPSPMGIFFISIPVPWKPYRI